MTARVQRQLAAGGYYRGAIDGIAGEARAARFGITSATTACRWMAGSTTNCWPRWASGKAEITDSKRLTRALTAAGGLSEALARDDQRDGLRVKFDAREPRNRFAFPGQGVPRFPRRISAYFMSAGWIGIRPM